MPSTGRMGERRADIVPGSRGRTTAAPAVLASVEKTATDFAFDLSHDDPYRGGFTTSHHGRPGDGRHAIQVEIARRMYMEEDALRRKATFEHARSFCTALVARLGQLTLDELAEPTRGRPVREASAPRS
jgi:N-formylglutamate amidohydrolase